LGHIQKTSSKESDEYFKKRDINKNSLAISSNQSEQIKSYGEIRKNFYDVLESKKIDKCKRPKFWGGYYILPYYFEFWGGDEHRLNRREAFELNGENWISYLLQP
jgi:pyridoxamine 5'-phosphate oxidase